MFSVFAGGTVMGLILNAFGGNTLMEIPFWQHLMLGGFAFGGHSTTRVNQFINSMMRMLYRAVGWAESSDR